MKQQVTAVITASVLLGVAFFMQHAGADALRFSSEGDGPAVPPVTAVPEAMPDQPVVPEPPPIPPLSVIREVAGRSIEGRDIPLVVLGDGEYVVLLMASIHGNEAAGTPLLEHLANLLELESNRLTGRTVVLMPVVNPDGVAAQRRFNARDVDLNRNFPASNRQNSPRFGLEPLSEPEALIVYQVLERFLPHHIVTLHEPLECVDYDGPAEALAQAMSRCCPLPVKKLGSRPGSLGSYAGVTLGIPTVTFELPRNARDLSPSELWTLYGEALLAAVSFTQSSTPETDGKGPDH